MPQPLRGRHDERRGVVLVKAAAANEVMAALVELDAFLLDERHEVRVALDAFELLGRDASHCSSGNVSSPILGPGCQSMCLPIPSDRLYCPST